MKLLIIFVFGLAITVPVTTAHGQGQGRINNGQDARLDKFRYLARLDLEDEKRKITTCGGSLISRNYILTAAHCLENKVNATVYLGAINRYEAEAYRNVSRADFIMHDGFNSYTLENDTALIKIPTVELTDNIQLVKLPKLTEKKTFRNKNVIVTRRDRNGTSDFPTGLLQSIRLKVLSYKKCRYQFNSSSYIKESNLCAKTHKLRNCAGDSGGPVVLEKTKQQVGIVSWNVERACEKGFPNVFLRITDILQWIKDNSDVEL